MNTRRVLAVLWLLPTISGAQVGGPGRAGMDTAAIRRTIVVLEERIGAANFSCDYAFFAAVEAPEFIFTDGQGALTTRAEDLAGASSCRARKGRYELDDIRLQYHGGVVVFNARATTTVERDTLSPLVVRTRFTDVFVRRDTSWVLVAGHSSRIPAAR